MNKHEQPKQTDLKKQDYNRADLEEIIKKDGVEGETHEKNVYLVDKFNKENKKISFEINDADGFIDHLSIGEKQETNTPKEKPENKPENKRPVPDQKKIQNTIQQKQKKSTPTPEKSPEQEKFNKNYEKLHGGIILEEKTDKNGDKRYKVYGYKKIKLNKEYVDFLTNYVGLKDKKLTEKERQLKLKEKLENPKGKKNIFYMGQNAIEGEPIDKNQQIIETDLELSEGAAEVLRRIGEKRSKKVNEKFKIDFKDLDKYQDKPEEERKTREKFLYDVYYNAKLKKIEQIENSPKKKRETRIEERLRKLNEMVDCLDQVVHTFTDKKERQAAENKIKEFKKEIKDIEKEIKDKEAEKYKNTKVQPLRQTENIQFTPGKDSIKCPNLGHDFSQYEEPDTKEKVYVFNAKLKQNEKETVFTEQDWKVLVNCCEGKNWKEKEKLCIKRLTKRAKLTNDKSKLKYEIKRYPNKKVALRIVSPRNGVSIYTSLKMNKEAVDYFKHKNDLLGEIIDPSILREWAENNISNLFKRVPEQEENSDKPNTPDNNGENGPTQLTSPDNDQEGGLNDPDQSDRQRRTYHPSGKIKIYNHPFKIKKTPGKPSEYISLPLAVYKANEGNKPSWLGKFFVWWQDFRYFSSAYMKKGKTK